MRISIVTPVLNEERNLRERAGEISVQRGPWEWIVVDGGSDDGSDIVARNAGAQLIRAPRGRGPQLNSGAAKANGEALLFLHADTSLPPGALEAIRSAFSDANIVGGNFTFAFDDRSITGRFLGAVYAAKQRLFRVWYGDSAMFVRRGVFERLGGFADIPIMEDIRFVERLRDVGRTTRLRLIVRSSARRYRGRAFATILRWTTIFGLYKCGVSPHLLARYYQPHREDR
ncbi:MAG: TIGR04283 family arsenosugar biosynthesis glycosyltransferase [Candidatus Elarobacter sp.]